MKKIFLFLLLSLGKMQLVYAQDMQYARKVIDTLCSNSFAGRGYVENGLEKAANYLAQEFKKMGLREMNDTYFQSFGFPVNTFPENITCTLDGKVLKAGYDFLLAPESGPCNGTYNLYDFDLADSVESKLYEKKINEKRTKQDVFVLNNLPKNFQAIENDEIEIINVGKKITHSVAQDQSKKCQLIFADSIIEGASQINIVAQPLLITNFISKNIIAYVPAAKRKNREKFIVFSAHYDHLGKMGNAIFPGASDNASGVSLVLNLAKHYAKLKNNYSMVFILFSGEEAGLLGSDYFVNYQPWIPLKNIAFLINLDIMGNAENGVVVVNASEYPRQFNLMTKINQQKKYVPEVRSRGKARNSDHYYFSEKGVPAFFIYSNGGPGYYHDVLDKPSSLTLKNYEGVYKLILDFVEQL